MKLCTHLIKTILWHHCVLSFFFAGLFGALPTVALADDAKPVITVVISREKELTPDHDDYYFSKVLELALTKTISSHGPYQIKLVPVMPIGNRLLREIEAGRVDITWMPYNVNA